MTAKSTGLAKQAQATSKAKQDFIPSTGDEDYLKSTPSEQEVADDLNDLADDINTGYMEAIGIAQKATARMIVVGNDLLQARAFFKGDLEFGRWRKSNINFSQSHCARLMQVSREFGNNKDALALPISTLSELCAAPPALKEQVIKDAADGKPTTKAAVIKAKKDAKESDSSPLKSGDNNVLAEKPIVKSIMTPPVETPEERANKWLALPVAERIAGLEVRGKHSEPMVDAFLMFGIPPFHEGLPSIDTIHFLWHAIGAAIVDSPELMDKFTVAYDYILEIY